MLSFRFAQYYVWVVLKTLYTINRHSYLRGFLVCPQSLGCRHDAEEGSQLVYIPQKLTGLRLFSLINDFFLVNLHSIILPWWWNGRHEGLKIPWTEMSVRVRFPPEAQNPDFKGKQKAQRRPTGHYRPHFKESTSLVLSFFIPFLAK